jgi:hypothetical protein
VAVLVAASINVLVLVAGFVLKEPATPLPRPLTDKVTRPLKPFDGVIVIAAVE